jgi:hypothetical protein
MLKNKLFTFNFFRFVQTGLYVDFFIKKIIELFVKNYLVLTAQFFGEKYMIEFLTKKIIDSWFFNNNKLFGLFEFTSSTFFVQFISFLFLFLSVIVLFV